ncbi:aldose 1-epimerase [Pseudonocardia sediminis]|uniref:Aldose 1-epimerase n=1 Tax=Pseudonocardia sediminis TaxID=1397368 RepID=A0A4Q7V1U0_PSEST|nr:aldose 1-epimerase family protein [Pseudonocardia sediminis]RZT86573.1 aldose 1-epimerase [Pseudonocardia sediminis]
MSERMDPSGRTFEITDGDAHAVVYEVGATLGGFTSGGLNRTEPYPPTQRPPKGAGAVLAPWPNRVRAGQWSHDGVAQQLPLTEPDAGNAIHGLLRHVAWQCDQHVSDGVTLSAVATVQPGWPQPVRVAVTYSLENGGLVVSTTATNLGDGPVPFGLGFHPYLRVGDIPTDELALALGAHTELPLTDQLPDGDEHPLAGADPLRTGLVLAGEVLDAAYGGCAPADGDTLVRHRLTAADDQGTELWADPAFGWVQVFTSDELTGHGRAVAVEPMTCPPDALNSGTDLVTLEPEKSWTAAWGLRPIA